MKQMSSISRWPPRLILWFGWMLTTTVGISVVAVVLVQVFVLLSWIDLDFVALLGASHFGHAISLLSQTLVGGAIGAVLGASQSLVLRHHIRQTASWVWATAIGMAIGNALSYVASGMAYRITYGSRPAPFPAVDPSGAIAVMAIKAAVVGIAVGMVQWLVLRRKVRVAGWWVLASVLGWSVGMIPGHWGGAALHNVWGSGGLGWHTLGGLFIHLVEPQGLPIIGAVVGAITGVALVLLIRGHTSEVVGTGGTAPGAPKSSGY